MEYLPLIAMGGLLNHQIMLLGCQESIVLHRHGGCSSWYKVVVCINHTIRSRTFDLSDIGDCLVTDRMKFGDGQARGLAARLAWQLVLNLFRQKP